MLTQRPTLWWWLKHWLLLLIGRLEPHEEILRREVGVYLQRWFVLPYNPWLRIYLHRFIADDEDEAMHDHPWVSLSVILWGQYDEITPVPDHATCTPDEAEHGRRKRYRWLSVIYRPAEYRHRICLVNNKPCWTLFFTGPKVREWGFWCPQGFVHWRQFEAGIQNGIGCGE
jgi:hypothetical protein